jgi:hypothetical protein
MDYDRLAPLVARDLTAYLTRRIPELDLPVYAVGLYVEDHVIVSIATESSPLDREQSGPAGLRWSSGEWAIPGEEFLTAETEEALAPPVTRPGSGRSATGSSAAPTIPAGPPPTS